MPPAETALRLCVAVLATWRLAHLLAFEDGPLHAVARLRRALGRLGGVLDCFYCLSLWVAALLAPWSAGWTTAGLADAVAGWAVTALGLSGAACVLQRLAAQPVMIQPHDPGAADAQPTGEHPE